MSVCMCRLVDVWCILSALLSSSVCLASLLVDVSLFCVNFPVTLLIIKQ